ncbi:TrlF family AAA-like ATPase [Trueperella pyogenes]|uniref:TrlF family AAA-like ATPase n=1 Tax=Trueperella pyogenes TaxID=1661 RepID=UPI0021672809|nr:AAA family ATPase [Trueperella pyogenes]UVJ57430.1 AAA family ATPase [Trueperella pyogenes]
MINTDAGARWIRAALQVNPFTYEGRNSPKTFFSDEAAYNSALLDTCQEMGISMIAVTDHWCVDSAAGLIAAAEDRGIVALPGFEANSSEGIHILVIFEAGTPIATIDAAIGRCGATPGCNNGTTGEPFAKIMEHMTAAGALPVPAHVNVEPAGLLTTRSGQPLAMMILHEDLHAIGVSPNAKLAKDQEEVVNGSGIFERVHPLAVIHADDVMGPRQLRQPGASTWFKVSSCSLESLKLAVRTPETRVSLDDPQSKPQPRIKSVSWVGGYFDGVTVPISSDLTALIGGRGAGKSTVIESIRYALEIQPISAQMVRDHKAIVDQVLNVGTIVRVEVESVAPTLQSYTIQREVPHPPVVLDSAGIRTSLAPADVIGAVEVFGQHELAELSGDSDSIAKLIRRFNGSVGEDPALEDVRKRLRENREELRKAEEAKVELEEELAQADRLEEQLDRYKETDVPGKLRGHEQITLDQAVFTEGTSRIAAARTLLDQYRKSASLTNLDAVIDNIDGAPQMERLSRVKTTLEGLRRVLEELGDQAADAINAAQAEIQAAQADWEAATSVEREGYGEVLRSLADEGLDPGKYIAAKERLASIKAAAPRLDANANVIRELLEARSGMLDELRAHEMDATERLHEAIRSANNAAGGVVVVKPLPTKDRSHVVDLIKAKVSGQRTQIVAAIQEPTFSPQALAEAIRAGTEELAKLGIRGAQASNLLGVGEELARELEELTLSLGVEVLLMIDGLQGLRSLDQLSKGQRATALLLLLLSASDAPLIIDQPEDDLDNNFIYKGVVRHLRELKGKRQIIASTHNANVPVLGDAELIVVLENDGDHGRPSDSGVGSLDDRTIRYLAENILEGGPAAFNARQHLYGF